MIRKSTPFSNMWVAALCLNHVGGLVLDAGQSDPLADGSRDDPHKDSTIPLLEETVVALLVFSPNVVRSVLRIRSGRRVPFVRGDRLVPSLFPLARTQTSRAFQSKPTL
jgi:hypothetical protein